ncbi:MAG: SH3 domain-containing protein [Candidatus Spyradosoma sp.]
MRLFRRFGTARRLGFAVLLWLCGALFASAAEALRVGISPNVVTENRMATFVVHCDDGESLRGVPAFPAVDGVVWHANVRGSRTSWVNGRTTRAETFGFTVTKPGEIEIPAFRVETSKGERLTRPLRFTVGRLSTGLTRADGSEMPLAEAVFLVVQAQGDARESYFVGEEIPVLVCALSRPGLDARLTSRPALTGGADAFVAAEKGYAKSSATFRGERFDAAIFPFDLRAMKAGTFTAAFSASADCVFDDGSARDPFGGDPFFGGLQMRASAFSGGSAVVSVPLNGELKGVVVRARPPVPAGATDLGIVSENAPSWEFSSDAAKCGEPLYLDLKIRGNASGLVAPEPSVPGFRTYPAEISETPAADGNAAARETRVRLMLIPLEAGERKVSLTFATLNPATGDYTLTTAEKTFSVEENRTLAAPAVSGTLAALPPSAAGSAEPRASANAAAARAVAYIRPLTPETLARGKTPPGDAALALWALPFVVAPAAFAVARFRARRERDDPARERRRRARARKGALLKKLADATPENFDALVREDVSDWLADAKGAASADAIRDDVRRANAELAEVLDAAEKAGYLPNARCAHFEKFRAIVARAVRSGAFAFVAALVGAAAFPDQLRADEAPAAAPESAPAAKILAAEDAYARGDFAEAERGFAALAAEAPFAADVWFDLGNAFFAREKNAAALVCFERARRLDVGRGDVVANLNAARFRLGQPPLGEVKTPLDAFAALRDSFSPTAWTLFAVVGFSVCALAAAFLRRRRLPVLALGTALLAFGAFSFWIQRGTLQDADAAIVLADGLVVRDLPVAGDASARAVATLAAGTPVRVAGGRAEFCLIRFGDGAEGWVEKSAVARLWGDWSVPADVREK